MTLWIARAGGRGERESLALDEGVAVIGWGELADLGTYDSKETLRDALEQYHPDRKARTISSWVTQVWAFSKEIGKGDVIALPLKSRAMVAVGKVSGAYRYSNAAPHDAKHQLPVQWLGEVPRNNIPQDILYSLGALPTVCRVKAENAEARLMTLVEGKTLKLALPIQQAALESDEAELDVESYARDQIRRHINEGIGRTSRVLGDVAAK